MKAYRRELIPLAIICLLVAQFIDLLGKPAILQLFLPSFSLLCLLYFILYYPARIGLGFAFIFGLWLDLSTQSLLGMHALLFTIAAFVMLSFNQRLRLFPIWQQMWVILFFALGYEIGLGILSGASLSFTNLLTFIAPALITSIFWLPLQAMLRKLCRQFTMST